MSCFGVCNDKPPKKEEFKVVFNKAAETAAIETQTSDHEPAPAPAPEPSPPPPPPPVRNTVAVIDAGSSKIRAGFAGDERPLATIPNIVGTSLLGDISKKVFGAAALTSSSDYKLSYPVEKGLIKDFHDAEDILEYVIDNHLQIHPRQQQIILTDPLNNSSVSREKMGEIIFEKFMFSGFYLLPSTPMAMYGYGATTGVMVESGAGQTHIVALSDGDYILSSYRHLPFGGDDLSKYLGELLTQNGKSRFFHGRRNEKEILNEIKHIGCHVCLNYDEEMKASQNNSDFTPHNAILHDGTMVGLNTEAFQVPEILFKPELIGIRTGGIPQNICDCIESCNPALKENLYKNIILCGGNTLFDNITDRLLWEVKTYAGPNVNVRIITPPSRDNLVFLGSSLIGVCPRLRDNLISYQEYREAGPQILQWKAF